MKEFIQEQFRKFILESENEKIDTSKIKIKNLIGSASAFDANPCFEIPHFSAIADRNCQVLFFNTLSIFLRVAGAS